MLSVADFDSKIPEIPEAEKSKFLVPKTLLLNRKSKYKKLRDAQINRTINVRKPGSHKYEFQFEITLEDTASTEMFLYQKDFSELPKNIVLLWVCSVKCEKSFKRFDIPINQIDWHFSVVETKEELTSKHKGIISRLRKNDLLIAAGEIYITDTDIQWNNMTGALKKNMNHNEQILGGSYINLVLTPLLQNLGKHNFIYQKDILKKYAPEITYDYCNKLLKKDLLDGYKKKTCNC